MEKNMIIAVSVSVLILFLWPTMFGKKQPTVNSVEKPKTVEQSLAAEKPVVKKEKIQTQNKGDTFIIENDVLKVVIDSKGAAVKQAIFKKYKSPEGQPLSFFGASAETMGALKLSDAEDSIFSLVSKKDNSVVLKYNGIRVEYSLEKSAYALNSKITYVGAEKIGMNILSFLPENTKDEYGLNSDPDKRKKELLIYSGEKVQRLTPKDIREKQVVAFSSSPKWVGVSDRYFLFSVITPANKGMITDVVAKHNKSASAASIDFDITGNDGVFEYVAFVGPKDVTDLRKVDPTLAESIDYGWLTVISVPMLELMKFFYRMIPNYGVAILILTLFVRLLMFPLQQKSMKSMKKMQELQPHIKALQEKYKGDKEKLNAEMMQFMKTHKMNPMSGCLPMLLQLPVFIALYKVLANSVELYRAPFMFWITDLSIKDPYYVLPVLMGVMMFLQQKMTPNPTMDPTQAKMMMYMLPVIFTIFMISLPSGLTLYIMFSTLLGILQQHFMNKQTSYQKI